MRVSVSAPFSKSKTSFAKFVPIWMSSAPSIAIANGRGRRTEVAWVTAPPTNTGATATGNVAGRDARIHAPNEPGAGSSFAGVVLGAVAVSLAGVARFRFTGVA
jgi:hypothetical protein